MLVVGAGQSGLATAFGLMRSQVTNILVLDVSAAGWAAGDLVAAAGGRGVLGYPTDARHARFVWHLDVDDEMTEHAQAVLLDLLARGSGD